MLACSGLPSCRRDSLLHIPKCAHDALLSLQLALTLGVLHTLATDSIAMHRFQVLFAPFIERKRHSHSISL